MATVKIPTPLRRLTGEKDEIKTTAENVAEMILDLEKQFPGMQERLCDNDGTIRKFINIYVNEEDIRFIDGEKTNINENDVVSIIPAIAGGF
jgi:molybdopterin synthase sulfur carrier subunit|tara:strand:- start:1765 stop:2040 length:276 start_codon:yes stop_codon:yes gene_type:complete